MSSSTSYRHLIDRMTAEMKAGNLEGVLAQLHPDVVVHEAASLPYGGTWTGHEGFADLITKIMSLAELKILDHTGYETADRLIAHMTLGLRCHATGDVLTTDVVEIYRVADGLISDIDVYYKDVHALVAFFNKK